MKHWYRNLPLAFVLVCSSRCQPGELAVDNPVDGGEAIATYDGGEVLLSEVEDRFAVARGPACLDARRAEGGGSLEELVPCYRELAEELVLERLLQPDANEVLDVFVHDRQSGATELVSINSAGAAPLYGAYSPAISGDGRYVAFSSYAWDLVHGDRNDALDVFVRDREFGVMTRASVSSTGEEGDAHSFFPAISADGSQVAFGSYATNLVPGDGNGQHDLFVRDLAHAATTRVSVVALWSCR